MNDKEVSTISLVAHENSINRLYKVIRLLIIAIIVLCIAFASYICYDRYLDVTVTDASDMSLEQNANDNGKNAYLGGDYIVSANNNKDD